MRIVNATDLFGNPYLTSASVAPIISGGVLNALAEGDYLDGCVKENELADKIEGLGEAVATALETGNYLGEYLKEEELADKLEEIGVVTSGTVLSEKIEFTNSDSAKVEWTGDVATFTHGLDCIPSVVFYDNDNKQILVEVAYVDSDTFTVDFQDKTEIDGTWTAVVYRTSDGQ